MKARAERHGDLPASYTRRTEARFTGLPHSFQKGRKTLSPAMTTRSATKITHSFPTRVMGRWSVPDQPRVGAPVRRTSGGADPFSAPHQEVHDGLPEGPRGDRVDVVTAGDLHVAAAPVAGELLGTDGERVPGPRHQ